jgi:hypothetical protein
MPKNTRILQSQQALNTLITIVHPYLPLDLQNTRITAEDIISVLGYASANRISPNAACHELKEAPSAIRLLLVGLAFVLFNLYISYVRTCLLRSNNRYDCPNVFGYLFAV